MNGIEFLRRVLTSRVYEIAKETPLQYAPLLSSKTKSSVWLKREDTQRTFGFNVRGAHHALASRDSVGGVVACAAGNHAEGVAMSARSLNIDATIVVPSNTSKARLEAIQRHRPKNIVRVGVNFKDVLNEARRISREENLCFIHPFDDDDVIVGQATVGAEIVRQIGSNDLDAIFCVTGGGGLLSGISAYVKQVRPDVKIIGVETEDAAPLYTSMKLGMRTKLTEVGALLDDAAPNFVGKRNFALCRRYVDDVIRVSTDEICAAVKDAFDETRVLLDPAGAAGVAAVKKYAKESEREEETYVAVTSGANIDFNRLRFVAERADDSEAFFAVTIPERPGSFRSLYETLYPRNVTEFSYRLRSEESSAHIYLSFQPLETDDPDATNVMSELCAAGYGVVNLNHNELAKAHARYLVGGRANVRDERIFRFEFPERPGALRRFLESLSESVHLDFHTVESWNVSLFHYRSHGDDIGRVLAGIQVSENHEPHFEDFLDRLGYVAHEETQNEVYRYFLK